MGRLGTVTFPNSGNSASQEPFLRGIALLHSFEYVDAAEAFREAQEADDDFALAYWFEALTHHHPLWGQHDREAALGVLARLARTPGERLDAAPVHERAWGEAVEALYGSTERSEYVLAHAAAMRRLAAERPADPEAAAFASVAVQGLALERPPAELETLLDEAAALAQRVYEQNPDHPGATHYLIHAYDTPSRAPRGVHAARTYAALAPAAQHALHMPSHIFVQLGLWEDAIASNRQAWAASRAWVARREAPPSELDFHSLTWLQYAYLQAGRTEEARAILDTARAVLGDDPADYPDARYAQATLAFQFAANTGEWHLVPNAEVAAPNDNSARQAGFAATHQYQVAAARAMRGDTSTVVARRIRADMAPGSRLAQAGASDDARRGAEIRAAQLEGLAARAAGNLDRAIERFRVAADLQAMLPPVGPPYVIPSEELLGEALNQAGRYAEAESAFKEAVARRPNRRQALAGLARARAGGGG
jgi:tetratricopeptide (TPR) repeat protein